MSHHLSYQPGYRRGADERERLGQLAADTVPVALRLAGDVRTADPYLIARTVERIDHLPGEQRRALWVVLAALIPDHVDAATLLDWVTWDEHGAPLAPAPPPRRTANPAGRFTPRPGEGPTALARRTGMPIKRARAVYENHRRHRTRTERTERRAAA